MADKEDTTLTMAQLVEDMESAISQQLETPTYNWTDPHEMIRSEANAKVPMHYASLIEVLRSDYTLFTDEPDDGGGCDVADYIQRAIYERLVQTGEDLLDSYESTDDEEEDNG